MAYSVTLEKYVYANTGAQKGTRAGVLELLLKVRGQAVALCPVDKGQLRNSHMVKIGNEKYGFNSESGEKAPSDQQLTTTLKDDDEVIEGAVGTGSDHWYPEFGTRYQVAQPHLRPAAEVATGSKGAEVMKKYCRDEMVKAFKQKKYERLFGGSGG